jgi:hypothetical protein
MSLDITEQMTGAEDNSPLPNQDTPGEVQPSASEKNLVKTILKRIRADKQHHKKAFAQMREDMYVARHGHKPGYPVDYYKANITGRHIKQKTASLYAKNPKAVARRRETIDYRIWDEKPQSLQMAMQIVMQAQTLLAQNPMADPSAIPPEMMLAFEEAQATVQDFQEGTKRRQEIGKIGKTLEILFAQALREQKPLDFKAGMKQLVRRACTTGVGYVELGFQRETGPKPELTQALGDFRTRLSHLKSMAERIGDTENPIDPDDPEIAELEKSIAALMAEPEIVLREGLIIDFPQSTKVIPDKLTRHLTGFVGARWITLDYMFTPDQIEEIFGVDIGKNYNGYNYSGQRPEEKSYAQVSAETDPDYDKVGKGEGLVCVSKHYDKTSGLVYFVADGYDQFLREPAAPDVFVEDFWPVYALTFNAVESEDELFPPSDVHLMYDMQREYNTSRQGKREHRKAARPRYSFSNGALEKEDVQNLETAEAFSATGVNLPPNQKLSDILDVIPVPGVDPNLYDTNEIFSDVTLVVGTNESQFGGIARATATESAIAANASASSDGSSIDDLDAFLTCVARAAGQVLLREMSPETVKKVAGPGAVWPQMTLADIADELFLEVEAGSTGKPNQAVEIQNWTQMMPFLLQMQGIDPIWLARESIRRLDDRLDLTEAIAEGTPSMMAANHMAQLSTGDPTTDPNAQGGEGSANAARPTEEQAGSDASFGSNQTQMAI